MRGVVAAVLLTALAALAPATGAYAAAPATARAAAPAGLSVSIHNGSTEVRQGDRLAYTATVKNSGTDPVDGRLVITVPSYVQVTEAADADDSGADASWAVTVPPGGSVTKKLTGVLEKIPKGEVRVTTLVSLYLGDAKRPAIRSAEADTIAGVKDPAHAVSDQAGAASAPGLPPIAWVGLGIAAVVAIGAVFAWQVTRRRRAG